MAADNEVAFDKVPTASDKKQWRTRH